MTDHGSLVRVFGLPSPAGCDPRRTWRAAADLVVERLHARFGALVRVDYVELFSPEMAAHASVEEAIAAGEATPPIVEIDGRIAFHGGKLNVSAIERAVAVALGAQPTARSTP